MKHVLWKNIHNNNNNNSNETAWKPRLELESSIERRKKNVCTTNKYVDCVCKNTYKQLEAAVKWQYNVRLEHVCVYLCVLCVCHSLKNRPCVSHFRCFSFSSLTMRIIHLALFLFTKNDLYCGRTSKEKKKCDNFVSGRSAWIYFLMTRHHSTFYRYDS